MPNGFNITAPKSSVSRQRTSAYICFATYSFDIRRGWNAWPKGSFTTFDR